MKRGKLCRRKWGIPRLKEKEMEIDRQDYSAK